MPDRIPISINPEHAATRGYQTSGLLKLESMDRLVDRLVAPFGEVEVDLKFGRDGRRMFLQGNITGNAVLQCQRCLKDMNKSINHDFCLGLIHNEAEIEMLLPGVEPLLLDDTNISDLHLVDVIEDELELLLPMVVMHPEGLCEGLSSAQVEADVAQAAEAEQIEKAAKKNPFDVLRGFKKNE